MPCNDGRGDCNNARIEYRDNPGQAVKIADLTSELRRHKAMLCALTKELEERGILEDVAKKASKDGMIDVMGFVEEHEKEDERRMLMRLREFSKHEQDVIRKILNGK